jgi:hypothetical protein
LLLLYVKLVLTVSGEYPFEEKGVVGVMGWPMPAKGILRRSWIKERFLRGGGGERFGRGGEKQKGGGEGRGEWRDAEPFDVRFISSQPLFTGIFGDFGDAEYVDVEATTASSLVLPEAYEEEGVLSCPSVEYS